MKLTFYNTVKAQFGEEAYLEFPYKIVKSLARIRSSSHDFAIELGRYHQKSKAPEGNKIISRLCPSCCVDDPDVLTGLSELPLFDPILEDEIHVLRTCPRYEDIRQRLSSEAKDALFQEPDNMFSTNSATWDIGIFLYKVSQRRKHS